MLAGLQTPQAMMRPLCSPSRPTFVTLGVRVTERLQRGVKVLEVAVPGFTLPHSRGVQAKGGVQLSQMWLIGAAVLVVLVPDHHILQAVHIASPPCACRPRAA